MTSKVEDLISDLIQTEWYTDPRAQNLVSVTARVGVESVVALDIMAKDFNKSRSAFAAELLRAAIQEAFSVYWNAHPAEGREHLSDKMGDALSNIPDMDLDSLVSLLPQREDK